MAFTGKDIMEIANAFSQLTPEAQDAVRGKLGLANTVKDPDNGDAFIRWLISDKFSHNAGFRSQVQALMAKQMSAQFMQQYQTETPAEAPAAAPKKSKKKDTAAEAVEEMPQEA